MKNLMKIVIVLFLMYAVEVFALSPEIRFDMLKTKLSLQLKEQQYKKALITMRDIKVLGIKLPTSFGYFEGKALFESGEKAKAYRQLEKYVERTGKQDKYYNQALNYMVRAEDAYNHAKERVKREKIKRTKKRKAKCMRSCLSDVLPSFKEGEYGNHRKHTADSCDITKLKKILKKRKRRLNNNFINKNQWQKEYYANIREQKQIEREWDVLPRKGDLKNQARTCRKKEKQCKVRCD